MGDILIIALYIIGSFLGLLVPVMIIAFIISLITGKPFKQVMGMKSEKRKTEERKEPLSTLEKLLAFILGYSLGLIGILIVLLFYMLQGTKVKGENAGTYAFLGFILSLLTLCGFLAVYN